MQLAAEEKKLRRLLNAKAPSGASKMNAAVEDMKATGANVQRLRNEVRHREFRAASKATPERVAAMEAEREKRAARKLREPADRAARRLAEFWPEEVRGAALRPGNLTPDQGVELYALVEERRDGGLPAKKMRRYETLVSVLVGEDIFRRKREEAEAAAKQAALAEKARLDAIPVRTYSGKGGVYLPGYVFSSWLMDERPGTFSVVNTGVLTLLLLALENGQTPFYRSEVIDGDIVLDAANGFQLLPRMNPDAELSALTVRDSVRHLAKNGWLQIDTTEPRIRIRRGERATKLPEEATAAGVT